MSRSTPAVLAAGPGQPALHAPATACGAYAYLLPRTGHVLLGVVVTLLVLLAFYQLNRITLGDPLGFLGLGFSVALTVLLLLPSSRAALRS